MNAHLPQSVHAVSIGAWWCCRECDAARFCCPGCAESLGVQRPPDHPPALPRHHALFCPDCGAALAITVMGYRPNPTGEAPCDWPLSDRLPQPQHRHRPALRIPPPPPRKATQTTTRPRIGSAALLPPAEPCPPGTERHRLSDWQRLGWVPDGVDPSTVAAAYRRRFRVEPPCDPERKQTRAYSLRELGLSLGELGLAPPPDPLAAIWQRALQAVALPSARILLSQQARLFDLVTDLPSRPGKTMAVVEVVAQWLPMVEARSDLLRDALAAALGQPVAVELLGVEA